MPRRSLLTASLDDGPRRGRESPACFYETGAVVEPVAPPPLGAPRQCEGNNRVSLF